MSVEIRTVGIAVYVLRKHVTQTEVLLLRAAGAPDPRGGSTGAGWRPVAGDIRTHETEAQAALRETVEGTGLEPERLYAAPFRSENREPDQGPVGRIGIFVAYVDAEAMPRVGADEAETCWLPLGEAGPLLARPVHRDALAEIATRFVKRPPDEALRIA